MFETIAFIAALLGGVPPPLLHTEVDRRQLDCLANAVYYEAGIESFKGKLYVAEVIINRVNDTSTLFRDDICAVVKQPSRNKAKPKACQFSFTCDGVRKKPPSSHNYMYSRIAALTVMANGVMNTQTKHYARCNIKRKWMKNLTLEIRVGKHCFYR